MLTTLVRESVISCTLSRRKTVLVTYVLKAAIVGHDNYSTRHSGLVPLGSGFLGQALSWHAPCSGSVDWAKSSTAREAAKRKEEEEEEEEEKEEEEEEEGGGGGRMRRSLFVGVSFRNLMLWRLGAYLTRGKRQRRFLRLYEPSARRFLSRCAWHFE